MKFHNYLKEGLFSFIVDIRNEYNFSAIKNYISDLKKYSDFDSYFDNVVESITPPGPETDRDLEIKYNYIGSNLAIVAGLYYGDDLSLERIEYDYKPDLTREELKQEVITFTHHLLFGKEASGVEKVGELQIEQEGLVPMMNRIMTEVESDEAQKNELMKHFRVYQILSEQSLKEAAEAAKHDPHLMQVSVALNTLANRSIEASSVTSLASIESEVAEKDNDSKELEETRKASFVERYASDKKPSGSKKSVSFSSDL